MSLINYWIASEVRVPSTRGNHPHYRGELGDARCFGFERYQLASRNPQRTVASHHRRISTARENRAGSKTMPALPSEKPSFLPSLSASAIFTPREFQTRPAQPRWMPMHAPRPRGCCSSDTRATTPPVDTSIQVNSTKWRCSCFPVFGCQVQAPIGRVYVHGPVVATCVARIDFVPDPIVCLLGAQRSRDGS